MAPTIKIAVVWDATSYDKVDSYQIKRRHFPKYRIFPQQITVGVIIYYYYRYSALGPVWAETRAQSVNWYSSGTLHPGQVLRGSLPLLSPAFRRSHFRHQVPQRRERS